MHPECITGMASRWKKDNRFHSVPFCMRNERKKLESNKILK